MKKVYLKDVETQTDATSDVLYLCFVFYAFIHDYGGNTDQYYVKVPVLMEICDSIEDARKWKQKNLDTEYEQFPVSKCIVKKVHYTDIYSLPTIIESIYINSYRGSENEDDFDDTC